MELGLTGKVVLVTGASSAIGRATALAFADEKARIAVGYRTNREAAEETAMARQRGGHAIVWSLDLGQPSSLQRAVVADMRQHGWGSIVHVSTGLVEDGFPGGAAYLAAKAGLHGLTRVMSRELAAAGILTNIVMPGFTPADKELPPQLIDQARQAAATRQVTHPDDVARMIVFSAPPPTPTPPAKPSAPTATSSAQADRRRVGHRKSTKVRTMQIMSRKERRS